jgi:hypothetical protein
VQRIAQPFPRDTEVVAHQCLQAREVLRRERGDRQSDDRNEVAPEGSQPADQLVGQCVVGKSVPYGLPGGTGGVTFEEPMKPRTHVAGARSEAVHEIAIEGLGVNVRQATERSTRPLLK